jgi:hypothetical protein
MTSQRTASCACGQLKVHVSGEAPIVASCNCTQCQKRTGSVFGVSGYFGKAQITSIEGEHKLFSRSSDAGRQLEFHFCPACGSTVFWTAEAFPEMVGVAAGAFADPEFPAPTVAVWTAHKHPWVSFPPGVMQFESQRG